MEKPRSIRIPTTEVLYLIAASASLDRSVLVGIDVGAGAGKTTFTYWSSKRLDNHDIGGVVIVDGAPVTRREPSSSYDLRI